MKRLIILLLLVSTYSFGQTSIPSSGALTINQIKTVMFNLGELTSGERTGATSLSFLNGKSQLADKTAPYSISDWYGYPPASAVQDSVNVAFDNTQSGANGAFACTLSVVNTVYFSGTLQLGTILYLNRSHTTNPASYGNFSGMYNGVKVWFSTFPPSGGAFDHTVKYMGNCP